MNKRIIIKLFLSVLLINSIQADTNRFLPGSGSWFTNAIKKDLVALFMKAFNNVEKTNWSAAFNPLNSVIKEIDKCTNAIRDILLSNITALQRLDEIDHKKVWHELMVAISGGCDCVGELPIPKTYGQALAIQAEAITESLKRIGFSADGKTLVGQLTTLRTLLGEPTLADNERAHEMTKTIDTTFDVCRFANTDDEKAIGLTQVTVFALLELLYRQSNRLQSDIRDIKQEVHAINAKIGNLNDPSVDPLQLVYASDVDNAELTIIQWVKTIFRAINNGPIS